MAAAAEPENGGAVRSEELPAANSRPDAPVDEKPTAGEIAPTSKPVVVIDPGHGGGDTGEVGAKATREKDVVLQIALVTTELLKDSYEVVLTRREDVSLTQEQRSSEAVFRDADAFVSLHLGASSSTMANSIGIFVPGGSVTTTPAGRTMSAVPDVQRDSASRQFAGQLASSLHESTSATMRGVFAAPCRVFQGLAMPAVLVEAGFVTNPLEEDLLAGEAYQRSIAEGLAAGIRAFLSSQR
jgi:N-acetylmuramoyl-L-alanine amidase